MSATATASVDSTNLAEFDPSDLSERKLITAKKASRIIDYLKTGVKPTYNYNGNPIFCSTRYSKNTLSVILKDGVFSDASPDHYFSASDAYFPIVDNERDDNFPMAVIVGCKKRTEENADSKLLVLVNGDEDRNHLVTELAGYPVASFNCLARLTVRDDIEADDDEEAFAVANRLAKGEIRIVDYIPDNRIKLNRDEVAAWSRYDRSESKLDKDGKPISPPVAPVGYTRVGQFWHRSATVLFFDTKSEKSYIIGQDDGTYFGCELPTNPKNIDAAYRDLTPTEARGVAGVKRQGEWFAVPVGEKVVPSITAVAATFEEIALPVDDPESNVHTINSGEIYDEDLDVYQFTGRVSKDGKLYTKGGSVTHSNGDHPDMVLDDNQWYTFYRNTAIKSVSVEGVD